MGDGKTAISLLKNEILDMILLRRTKEERAEDINLPKLSIIIRRDKMSDAEKDFYEGLYKQSELQFSVYAKEGTVLHNYAHIFDLISRLRQSVLHPYLVVYSNSGNIPTVNASNSEVCALCHDDIDDHKDETKSKCNHFFHKSCVVEYMQSVPVGSTPGCPSCFLPLTVDLNLAPTLMFTESTETVNSEESSPTEKFEKVSTTLKVYTAPKKGILSRIQVSNFKSSTKIEALLQELKKIEKEDESDKSIVFSQYTALLDLVEWRLKKADISCAKMVGSMSLAAKTNVLYAFNMDSSFKVILISLKAGGEGLNLQIANHIFLMDPWWNPAAEMQAIQRAHRIGQTKPVTAIRFICEDSIEERMLQLQEKKRLVFDGTVGEQDAAMAKLNVQDLQFLFQNN